MGLFIGASILTILELFDYAYEVSLNFFIHIYCHSNSNVTFSAARVILEKKGDKSKLAYCRADWTERSFSIRRSRRSCCFKLFGALTSTHCNGFYLLWASGTIILRRLFSRLMAVIE